MRGADLTSPLRISHRSLPRWLFRNDVLYVFWHQTSELCTRRGCTGLDLRLTQNWMEGRCVGGEVWVGGSIKGRESGRIVSLVLPRQHQTKRNWCSRVSRLRHQHSNSRRHQRREGRTSKEVITGIWTAARLSSTGQNRSGDLLYWRNRHGSYQEIPHWRLWNRWSVESLSYWLTSCLHL